MPRDPCVDVQRFVVHTNHPPPCCPSIKKKMLCVYICKELNGWACVKPVKHDHSYGNNQAKKKTINCFTSSETALRSEQKPLIWRLPMGHHLTPISESRDAELLFSEADAGAAARCLCQEDGRWSYSKASVLGKQTKIRWLDFFFSWVIICRLCSC